jgi:hypothetical protein
MSHQCNSCSKCKKIKKKLDTYEKFIKEIHELDKSELRYNTNPMEESIIIDKDNFGNINRKVRSDLSESFLIVDRTKDLSELNKKEQQIILEQDSYHNYKNASNKLQKANGVYKVARYVIGVGKWLIFL